MINVNSSNISAVELREADGKTPISDEKLLSLLSPPTYVGTPGSEVMLYVRFNNGGSYLYEKVPFHVAAYVALAGSCGKALNEKIKKGGYQFKRLED